MGEQGASSPAAWKEKAEAFLSSSSLKLKAATVVVAEAATRAGSSMAEVATKARGSVAEVATKAGSSVADVATKARGSVAEVAAKAGSSVAEVATKAGTSVAGAAGGAGNAMKSTWQTTREGWNAKVQPTVEATWQTTREGWNAKVQPKVGAGLETVGRVASDTGQILKKGLLDTRELVASSSVGRTLSEVTKGGIERSKNLLQRVDWRFRSESVSSTDPDSKAVFGLPLEIIVQRQMSPPVPHVVTVCVDFISERGLNAEYIFENEGNPEVVKRLIKRFDQGNENIPMGMNPVDVAQLLMVYFKCLPEPLLMFELYDEIAVLGSSDPQRLKQLLQTLPPCNRATLRYLMQLLHKISERAHVNKMDAESLAAEFAPVLLWRNMGHPRTPVRSSPSLSAKNAEEESPQNAVPSKGAVLSPATPPQEDANGHPPAEDQQQQQPSKASSPATAGAGEGSPAVTEITQDDEPSPEQTSIVQAVVCIILHHSDIFPPLTDPSMVIPFNA